jgi:hypothetical protein
MKSWPRRRFGPRPFRRWQRFVEYWHGEGRTTTCCQFATEQETQEQGVYNCTLCPVADALYELRDDTLNYRAWGLYHQCANRFTFESGAASVVLARLTQEDDQETFHQLLDRLIFAFDTFCPPPEPPHGT